MDDRNKSYASIPESNNIIFKLLYNITQNIKS